MNILDNGCYKIDTQMIQKQAQLPIPQIMSTKKLNSSAFPQNSNPVRLSTSHQILQAISYDVQQESRKNQITIRPFDKNDVHELKKINLQFFPLKYSDAYYFKFLTNEVYAYIAELSLKVQCDCQYTKHNGTSEDTNIKHQNECKISKIKSILDRVSQQHKQVQNSPNFKMSNTKQLDKMQNVYFISQNINFNKERISLNIIVGQVGFTMKDSEGYLQYPIWRSYVLGQRSSLYIGTLGVIEEFRKKKIAQKLLENIVSLVDRTPSLNLVYLHVISYNTAAIKLYKKMGFQELEILQDFYHVENTLYQGVALGRFMNGGKKRKTWGQWLRSFWW